MSSQIINQIDKICKGEMNVLNYIDKKNLNLFIEASKFCIEKKEVIKNLLKKLFHIMMITVVFAV